MSSILSNRRALRYALEMVERMSGTDVTLVPFVPSDAMIEAGARSGNVAPSVAKAVYCAMIQEA